MFENFGKNVQNLKMWKKKKKRAASAIPRMKLLEYALDIEDYDTLGTLVRENITLLIILR